MANPQLELIGEFRTSGKANSVYCHHEFLEKLAAHGNNAVSRRAALLLQRLAVDERRLHYKATQGANRGWRRSRLGGNSGSHFYAWWAPRTAAPLKDGNGFASAQEGALFLRDIRHHDDHSTLAAQSFQDHYLPVTVVEMRREEYAPAPWTHGQAKFASARQPVRLLKGHPGSGKTTALWHAADAAAAERVLYVTYSADLAALARAYFDRFCPSSKSFHVVTYQTLLAELRGGGTIAREETPGDSRKRFLSDLAPFARMLGPWADNRAALYDELHAHLIGDAIPAQAGRFAACKGPRLPDKIYRDTRAPYLGAQAVAAALETATRLERDGKETLAERYFPALAVAWEVALQLTKPDDGTAKGLLDFDCIAVDECQDLTPVESYVLVQLAALTRQKRKLSPPLVLVAGDEAQTVRPTDFEWGWLSDLLHARLATPAEFKLTANLRSPRRIAELVNRVWDLYGLIQKQDRPSGTGLAEIEDDAPDQILYCTATPGEELTQLLTQLAAREGLALITLDDAPPDFVPPAVRPSVLTAQEVKGLDFHSVCVLNAGHLLERVTRLESRWRSDGDIEGLRRRLAIDRLRVALSRPSERLFWLDINPPEPVVRESLAFLNGGVLDGAVSSSVPEAILKSLEEEDLDVEERIQRCQTDARQYLAIRPELAWSRAQQAVTLLGRIGTPAAVSDEAARRSAYLTLAEVCFALAFRSLKLPAELGRPDLYQEARKAAQLAGRNGLGAIIEAIGIVQRSTMENRLEQIARLAEIFPRHKAEIEPWLLIEIGPKSGYWLGELESAMASGKNAAILRSILPPFYHTLDLPDAEARIAKLRQRAIQVLMKDKQFNDALEALLELPERQPKLEAACHEKLGNYRLAAECHKAAGNLKEALHCYRSIPDFEAALALVRESGDKAVIESLEWIAKLQTLIAQRPEKFNKTVTSAEKKLLEELLERGLGVTRKKPAPRKSPVKRTSPRNVAPL